jgi:tetratricopeptide (TPR) repeat protein
MIVLAALALLSAPPAAQSALARSDAALAEADFELALTLAEQAEAEAEDAATLARVYRQQGVVREILGRADQAVVAFARALRCDAGLTLDARTSKKSTLELFALARALDGARTDIVRVRKNLDARAGRDTTLCARPGEDSPLTATPPPAAGVGWPVWALAGTAVAGAGAAGVLGSLALSKNAECRSVAAPLYAQCDEQATTLETGANIAWTGAGVSAAAAIMVWWLSSD